MKMGFRWYGAADDSIPLEYVGQIPGVNNIVGAIYDVPTGEVWDVDRIRKLRADVEGAGFALDVIESVNIHDAIKIGHPDRDRYIENYLTTIRNLAGEGIKVIAYNFMPVFDWLRTDLRFQLSDGSYALGYNNDEVPESFEEMAKRVLENSHGYLMPGWEPERLANLQALVDSYQGVSEEDLAANLKYFLEAILPTCEEVDVRMAIHPDDPPWPIFGLPRIVKNLADLRRIEGMYESTYNGFTICTGSLGENVENDVPAILRELLARDKVPFVHLRNIKHTGERTFHESAHLSSDGSLDMYEIMKALADANYEGYARPDHGRDIWGEVGRPGYGLYDRGLGIAYLNGLWEAINKGK